MAKLITPFIAQEHPLTAAEPQTGNRYQPDWSRFSHHSPPYEFPPEGNLIGDVARFIMRFAYRIVPEIALAAAMAFVAGIVGRNYNVSNTGLNLYLLFVGPSGVGKDNGVSAMQALLHSAAHVNGGMPNDPIFDFIGPEQYGSSQGLIKDLAKHPVKVAPMGEFGLTLERMVGPNAKPTEKELKQKYLSLYSKSGKDQFFSGYGLASKDNSVERFPAPALTIFGEGTPEKINEHVLSRENLKDGFVSRLTIVQFEGEIPYRNKNRDTLVPTALAERINFVARAVLMHTQQFRCYDVPFASDDVRENSEAFDDHCVDMKNANNDDGAKELWTRTALKSLKLAALLAVSDDTISPVITLAHIEWAKRFELFGVESTLRRLEDGEAGEVNEDARVKAIVKYIKRYVMSSWPEIAKVAGEGNSHLHREYIVTYTYLHRSVANLKPFKEVRYGSPANALKDALKILTERGELSELSKAVMAKDHEYYGVAFAIRKPGAFGI